jgi:hypothetical protein
MAWFLMLCRIGRHYVFNLPIENTTVKKVKDFPVPAGMSLTKLSLAGNNSIIPGKEEFGKWHADWGRENP